MNKYDITADLVAARSGTEGLEGVIPLSLIEAVLKLDVR